MPADTINYQHILAAQSRIEATVVDTPIVSSSRLNRWLSRENLPSGQTHTILFKAECLQRTGAFKLRGATNFIAKLAENKQLPDSIVANSSGNHAQAVAFAASQFGISATIYAANNISAVKAAATRDYGAQLRVYPTRIEADQAVADASRQSGCIWIPPFNHTDIIAGQGTAVAETLQRVEAVDAVFTPCGGGGLTAGSLIATRHLNPTAKVFGVEPLAANDAAESLRAGEIKSLDGPAKTLADGAATPSVGALTFPFLQQLDGFYEVNERAISYWTQWLQHLLKLHIEPTCCMTMQAVAEWLAEQTSAKRIVVVLSGGNVSANTTQKIYSSDHLINPPSSHIVQELSL
ncbi:serine/threonine dehydratase [Alteromonas flava]|uniref:serine/threonine dehydratase n=1 Tax=Alteromonas flava TaxID=2048003 RepID=UPI000C2936A2|nr:serine/threonine dehydratase [Alteromonas flava]